MIECIAIDDEPSALKVIAIHAAKVPEINLVATFTDPYQALEYLKENRVNLMFLDINMPGLTGMELIRKLKCPPRIIFTTAYSEYAVESYEFEAVDYLLKPIEFDRFFRSIQRYQNQMNRSGGANLPSLFKYVFIKDGYKQVKLLVEDISHIQSDGNYLNIFTGNHRTMTRMSFAQILEFLPDNLFLRAHNSYLVNIGHINKIENNHISLNDVNIPIGDKYKENFFRRIGMESLGKDI